jgi:hypothetical protein
VVCNIELWAYFPWGNVYGRNPLTGLCGLQPEDGAFINDWGDEMVAIPLRGYVVCNSTPLRTPFWTALPEEGL